MPAPVPDSRKQTTMKHYLSLTALALAATLAACQSSTPPTSAEIEADAMQARQASDARAEHRVRHWARQGLPVAERELALVYQPRAERRDEVLHLFEQAARRSEERRVGKECRSRWS